MSNIEELKAFDETFKRILEDLSSTGNKYVSELQQTLEWVKETFIHNVPNGKRTRGLALVSTYKILANQSKQELTDDNLELARILGWCIEILHAFFLILDDIMDQSVTRRGQLCWFRQVFIILILNTFAAI
jgi:farnesyl diphosphate synthase